jgi:hypothetical protein
MNNGNLVWPSNNESAILLFLALQVKLIEKLGISLAVNGKDPIETAKRYLDSEISEERYTSAAKHWSDIVCTRETVTDFRSKDVLKARLAIGLLSATPTLVTELNLHLEWFVEIVCKMGYKRNKVIRLINEFALVLGIGN